MRRTEADTEIRPDVQKGDVLQKTAGKNLCTLCTFETNHRHILRVNLSLTWKWEKMHIEFNIKLNILTRIIHNDTNFF